ncbi:MAG: non-heme iron oxygenase ferredoxin subunit [Gammaproteobacteria bacterium]|nr:non-heme iron oxygenase ferredoxin subunit [Gammaproteobacteria bacterium]
MSQGFTPLCKTSEVAENTLIQVDLPDHPPIAVYNLGGEYFATSGYCTHADAALCDGYLEDDKIECPWHAAKFDIRSGKALTFPATVDLDVYPVKIEGDQVLADLNPTSP